MSLLSNRFRSGMRTGPLLVIVILGLGGLATGILFWITQAEVFTSPELMVKQYMARVYAQDYSRAYELISTEDKAYKSQEAYLQENNNGFSGFRLEAARRLASFIEFPEIQTDVQGDRAIVTVNYIVPDGNDPAVRDILFARSSPSGSEFTEAERSELLAKLDHLQRTGQIPTFEGEETFELVKETNGWRIIENWAASVRVHFSGQVMDGLAWEFEPIQETVLAKPGETLQAIYRARNLSDQPVTAKARHLDRPAEVTEFLNIIQCFCFIQQTLQPGEEVKLPLVFRVAWDVPTDVTDFYVHYEFYPLESFPEDSDVSVSQQ